MENKSIKWSNFYQYLFSLIKKEKKNVIYIFIISWLYSYIKIVVTDYFRILIDYILVKRSFLFLNLLSLASIFLYIVIIFIKILREYFAIKIEESFDLDLILKCHLKFLSKSLNLEKAGDLISRSSEALKMRTIISKTIIISIVDAITVVMVAYKLCLRNIILFIVALFLTFVYVCFTVFFKKRIKEGSLFKMKDTALMFSDLLNSVNNKGTNVKEAEKDMKTNFYKYLQSAFTIGMVNKIHGIFFTYLFFIGNTIVLWVGSYQVILNRMTLGELIVFSSYLNHFARSSLNLLNLVPEIQTAEVSFNRILEVVQQDSIFQ